MIKIVFILLVGIFLTLCSCKDIIVTEPESSLNVEDFEAAWKRIKDVYPYLEFKKINWDSIHSVYHNQIENAQGDEFFKVFGDFLAELKDGHVYYRTKGGGEVYP